MSKSKNPSLHEAAISCCLAYVLISTSAVAQTVTGTGATNQISKWSAAHVLTNSAITDLSGNVGIGTTSPARQLHIGDGAIRIDHSTDPAFFMLHRTGLKTFLFGVNASSVDNGYLFISDVGSAIRGVGTHRMTISNIGNIGIGTDTPASKLSVAGIVQSTSGGFKFPDGTVQLSAATGSGGSTVQHDATLTGSGTSSSKLGVAIPLVLSGSASGVVQGRDSGSGYGVYGKSVSGFGVYGEASIAVAGNSSSNIGLYGTGPYAGASTYGGTYGVLTKAYNTSGTADGVHTTGGNGVYAVSNRAGGNGVFAQASNGSTSDYAVWGLSNSGYAGVLAGT